MKKINVIIAGALLFFATTIPVLSQPDINSEPEKKSLTTKKLDQIQLASDNDYAIKLYIRAEKNFEDGYYESVVEDTLKVIRKTDDAQLRAKAFALMDKANERTEKHYSDIRNWSGPRIGAVGVIDENSRNALANAGASFPVVSAFGWQFEYRFISGRPDEKVAGLIIFAPMVLGIDQSVPMLSLNGIIGLRFNSEFEVGVGPHVLITPIDPYFHVGIVVAIGQNFKTSKLNFPLNLAVVLGKDMIRAGLLFGFNTVNQ